MTIFIEELTPHYSYLIEKQRELLEEGKLEDDDGVVQRNLRLLDTPEYTGLKAPLN